MLTDIDRWKQAELDEDIHYLGRLCQRGHEYEQTSHSLRYKRNCDCVRCHHEREREAGRRGQSKGRKRTKNETD